MNVTFIIFLSAAALTFVFCALSGGNKEKDNEESN